jgi:hypothetical protein
VDRSWAATFEAQACEIALGGIAVTTATNDDNAPNSAASSSASLLPRRDHQPNSAVQ